MARRPETAAPAHGPKPTTTPDLFAPKAPAIPPITPVRPPSSEPPKRRHPVLSVFVSLLLLGGIGYGGWVVLQTRLHAPPVLRLEAEAALTNLSASHDIPGYSGSAYLCCWERADQFVTFDVRTRVGGPHQLWIRYSAGDGQATRQMRINERSPVLVQFDDTHAWTTWSTQLVNVDLDPGESRITLSLPASADGTAQWKAMYNDVLIDSIDVDQRLVPVAGVTTTVASRLAPPPTPKTTTKPKPSPPNVTAVPAGFQPGAATTSAPDPASTPPPTTASTSPEPTTTAVASTLPGSTTSRPTTTKPKTSTTKAPTTTTKAATTTTTTRPATTTTRAATTTSTSAPSTTGPPVA